MGYDLYGLNQINPMNVDKPIINWGSQPSKKKIDSYFNRVSIYQKAVPGDYFRNSIWWWSPLWNFICKTCDDFLSEKDMEAGYSNSGMTISKTKSLKIARKLDSLDKDGYIEEFETMFKEMQDKMPLEKCRVCNGIGTRKEWMGWQSETAWLKYHKTLKENIDSINCPYKWANECKGCNGCKGKGEIKNYKAQKTFSTENVREFSGFCRNSGGFRIS